jgi:hypothetical protein
MLQQSLDTLLHHAEGTTRRHEAIAASTAFTPHARAPATHRQCRHCSMMRGFRVDRVQNVQDLSSPAAIRATHDSHGRDKSSIDGRQAWRESLPDLGYI